MNEQVAEEVEKESVQVNQEIDYEKIAEAFENAIKNVNEESQPTEAEQLESTELEAEQQTAEAEYKENVITLLQNISSGFSSAEIVGAINSLHSRLDVIEEQQKAQTKASVEGDWVIAIVICVTLSLKFFSEQISKW